MYIVNGQLSRALVAQQVAGRWSLRFWHCESAFYAKRTAERRKLQHRVVELEGELARVEQESWAAERVYRDKLNCELSRYEETRDCLRKREAEVRHLEGEKERLQRLTTTLQNSSQEKTCSLQHLDTAYTKQTRQLQSQVNRLSADIRTLESRVAELLDERHSLETFLEEKECELEEARSQLAVDQRTAERAAVPPDKPRKDDDAEEIVASAVSQLAQVLADRLFSATSEQAPPRRDGQVDDLTKIVARQSSANDLPTFSGDPAAAPMCVHTYHTSSRECGFSNQENMSRLQKALRGKALETVKAMLVLPDNVDRVVRTLEMRFGQANQVIQTMVEGVQKLRPLKQDNFEQLIDLANAIGNVVATMKLMDNTGHQGNPQLRAEILQKLPSSLKRQWGEFIAKVPPADVDLVTLSDWLTERADAVCRIQKVILRTSEIQSRPAANQKKPAYREMLLTTNTQPSSKQVCEFCKRSGHDVTVCRGLDKKTNNERWEWVKNDARCFNCLTGDIGPESVDEDQCAKSTAATGHTIRCYIHQRGQCQQTMLKPRSTPSSPRKRKPTPRSSCVPSR